jgi:SAM-dependent methyltransferase
VGATADEPIAAFYDLHPYPPPVDDLDALASRSSTGGDDRFAHHLIWPTREPDEIASILVAGCGTAQAARHALRHPHADVVGVDISAKAIEHSRRLAERHGIENLTTRVAPIESPTWGSASTTSCAPACCTISPTRSPGCAPCVRC